MDRETAAAYKSMRESFAFKHLMGEIEEIMHESVTDEDRVPTESLTVQVIAECRGVRKGLEQLLRRIEDISEWK